MTKPTHGDRSTCAVCGHAINYVVNSQWAGDHHEVLDAWWAHNVHPSDNHSAIPVRP